MRTSGYCLRPAMFWRATELATVHICETGTLIVCASMLSGSGGGGPKAFNRRVRGGNAEDAEKGSAWRFSLHAFLGLSSAKSCAVLGRWKCRKSSGLPLRFRGRKKV